MHHRIQGLFLVTLLWLASMARGYPLYSKSSRAETALGLNKAYSRPKAKRYSPSQAIKLDFDVVENTKSKEQILNNNYHRYSAAAHISPLILEIENRYSLYVANLDVGTPGETVQVQIDTGSSDLWLPAPDTTKEYTTLLLNSSTMASYSNETFLIKYGDGSSATGLWVTDKLKFGGVVIEDMIFGYATKQTAGQGVMGIGLKNGEASTWLDRPFQYDNFPFKLKTENLIAKAAYSLYLNSPKAKAGSILFGALDKAKYKGALAWLKLENIDFNGHPIEQGTNFYVSLDSVTNKDDTNILQKSTAALLDSGTTLTYAPLNVVNAIGRKYGKYNRFMGGYITSCSVKGDPVNFQFGNTTISVPFENFLYDLSRDSPIYTHDECLIGIISSGKNTFILGDGFLRSAYVVYDLEDRRCGVAQAVYSNQTEIEILH